MHHLLVPVMVYVNEFTVREQFKHCFCMNQSKHRLIFQEAKILIVTLGLVGKYNCRNILSGPYFARIVSL